MNSLEIRLAFLQGRQFFTASRSCRWPWAAFLGVCHMPTAAGWAGLCERRRKIIAELFNSAIVPPIARYNRGTDRVSDESVKVVETRTVSTHKWGELPSSPTCVLEHDGRAWKLAPLMCSLLQDWPVARMNSLPLTATSGHGILAAGSTPQDCAFRAALGGRRYAGKSGSNDRE